LGVDARRSGKARPDHHGLDPGAGVKWSAIIAAAKEVKERLEEAGLVAFLKTSGGKGLHVVAPLTPKANWPSVKSFTKAMAVAMAADAPNSYVSTISKAQRTGKILIDYLRNQRGATAVAPYSSRARTVAAVSAPLSWDELGPDIGPDHLTILNMSSRVAALDHDPWHDFHTAAVPLFSKGKPSRFVPRFRYETNDHSYSRHTCHGATG